MFSAIVTAMAGIFVLSAAGLLDVGALYLEPTNLAAQAFGGLLFGFGAGFIVGGYGPGTSVAAMATGRKDDYSFALGMLAGVLAYAGFVPGSDAGIRDTAQGALTLPTITGIGAGWWALTFIAFLAFAGCGMGKLESRFAGLRPRAPDRRVSIRWVRQVAVAIACRNFRRVRAPHVSCVVIAVTF